LVQLLRQVGVFSLQDFWYILHITWLHQIEIQYPNPNKSSYLRHIITGNNNDLQNLIINNGVEETIFLSTLSLVFDISIQINSITSNNTHTSTTINECNNTNNIKIINFRKSVDEGNIYEPWINPTILSTGTEVSAYTFTLACTNTTILRRHKLIYASAV
jgi:hypothetical protein